MQSEKEMAESAVSWTLFALVLALIGCAMTGCAQLAGVKEYHNGDTHILFTSATDFTFGWGQYDSADKYKGIKPGGGYSKARTVKARAEVVDPD